MTKIRNWVAGLSRKQLVAGAMIEGFIYGVIATSLVVKFIL